MNAKEMFEELEYKQEIKENNNHKNEYIIYYLEPMKEIQQAFCFCVDGNTVWTTKYEELFNDFKGEIYGITAKETLAITQQMKELGWIE